MVERAWYETETLKQAEILNKNGELKAWLTGNVYIWKYLNLLNKTKFVFGLYWLSINQSLIDNLLLPKITEEL